MFKIKVLLFLLFVSCPSWGQNNIEQLFQKENPNILYQNESRSVEHGPLVYIEGISDQPQPKTWKDKLKMRLFGSMEIPDNTSGPQLDLTPSVSLSPEQTSVEIQPIFGTKKQVAFFPHTADWHFMIHTSDTQTTEVKESITVVLTKETPDIIKDWPTDPENFQLLEVWLDGQKLPPNIQTAPDRVSFSFPLLPTGSHKIQLHYLFTQTQKGENIVLPLMGTQWPLLADTFSGILLSNGFYQLNDVQFLIGTNAKEYPENFIIKSDNQHNIYFKLNKILPTHTQIQLSAKVNAPVPISIFQQNLSNTLFGISIVIILLYGLFCMWEVYYMSLDKKLKRFHKISNHIFLNWLYRSGEMGVGLFLLILFSMIPFVWMQEPLSFIQISILVFLSLLLWGIADYFVFRPTQNQIKQMYLNQEKRNK